MPLILLGPLVDSLTHGEGAIAISYDAEKQVCKFTALEVSFVLCACVLVLEYVFVCVLYMYLMTLRSKFAYSQLWK